MGVLACQACEMFKVNPASHMRTASAGVSGMDLSASLLDSTPRWIWEMDSNLMWMSMDLGVVASVAGVVTQGNRL